MGSWNQPFRKAKVVILAGLLVLFCLGLACADGLEDARRRGKLLVGVKSDFPPFGYLGSSGTIQGFDADLARYLGRINLAIHESMAVLSKIRCKS